MIQRVSNQDASLGKVFYRSTTVPTSWTAAHTVPTSPQGARDLVTWATFTATDATAYTLQMRVVPLTGATAEIGQAQLAADGEQWRPMEPGVALPLEPGDQLQIIGSGAGTVNVNVYIAGVQHRPGAV